MKIGIRIEALGLPLKARPERSGPPGAAGVQVDAVGDLAPDQLGQTGRREFRNLLHSLNLELSAIGCPLRHGLDVAENLQQRIEYVRRVLTLSYDLGPRIAIVEMPRIPDEPKEAEPLATSAGGLVLGTASVRLHPAKAVRKRSRTSGPSATASAPGSPWKPAATPPTSWPPTWEPSTRVRWA